MFYGHLHIRHCWHLPFFLAVLPKDWRGQTQPRWSKWFCWWSMVYWSITFATVAITLLRSRWWQSLPSPWSSSSWDFSSQTLRLIKPRMAKEKQKKMFSQVEGFWSLAIVAYIAFVCVVSALRTQVILRHWTWMSSRSLKYSTWCWCFVTTFTCHQTDHSLNKEVF